MTVLQQVPETARASRSRKTATHADDSQWLMELPSHPFQCGLSCFEGRRNVLV